MTPLDHGDFRQLFRCGAEILHMPVCRHGKGIRDRNAERHLVLLITAFRHRAQRQIRRQAGQQAVAADHEYDLGEAAMNGSGANIEHRRRRRAGYLKRVRKGRLNT